MAMQDAHRHDSSPRCNSKQAFVTTRCACLGAAAAPAATAIAASRNPPASHQQGNSTGLSPRHRQAHSPSSSSSCLHGISRAAEDGTGAAHSRSSAVQPSDLLSSAAAPPAPSTHRQPLACAKAQPAGRISVAVKRSMHQVLEDKRVELQRLLEMSEGATSDGQQFSEPLETLCNRLQMAAIEEWQAVHSEGAGRKPSVSAIHTRQPSDVAPSVGHPAPGERRQPTAETSRTTNGPELGVRQHFSTAETPRRANGPEVRQHLMQGGGAHWAAGHLSKESSRLLQVATDLLNYGKDADSPAAAVAPLPRAAAPAAVGSTATASAAAGGALTAAAANFARAVANLDSTHAAVGAPPRAPAAPVPPTGPEQRKAPSPFAPASVPSASLTESASAQPAPSLSWGDAWGVSLMLPPAEQHRCFPQRHNTLSSRQGGDRADDRSFADDAASHVGHDGWRHQAMKSPDAALPDSR